MASHIRQRGEFRNGRQRVHRHGGGRRSRTAVGIDDGHHVCIHTMSGRGGNGVSRSTAQTIRRSPAELIRRGAVFVGGGQQYTLTLADSGISLVQGDFRNRRQGDMHRITAIVATSIGQRHGYIHIGSHIRAGSHRLRDGEISGSRAVVVRLTVGNRHKVRHHEMTVIRNQHRIGNNFCQIRTRRI